jgi:hypothetical protein
MNYVSNLKGDTPISAVGAAVEAVEKCQAARSAMDATFDDVLILLLGTIPPLLPSVTNPIDQNVVDGLLRELAVGVGQSKPWVTPKGKRPADADLRADTKLSSRVARDLIATTLRVIREQLGQHCLRMELYRDLVQAGLDAVHAARVHVSDADRHELDRALAKLDLLSYGVKERRVHP